MDEIWLHQSEQTQQSARKVMASVFWEVRGIIFIDYPEKGSTINSDYYIELLDHLKDKIIEKWPHMSKKKVLFHQDNAQCHKSVKTIAKIHELRFELLLHPPDLAPTTISCSKILKECSLERNFCGMKRWSPKLRSILEKGEIEKSLYSVYYPWRELCWIKTPILAKNIIFTMVGWDLLIDLLYTD